MDSSLFSLIEKSKNKDKQAILNFIIKFNPLIKKYSNKLNYDGAESDLIIKSIELINKIPIYSNKNMREDKYIISYVNTAIKNKYIELNKINKEILKREIEINLDIVGTVFEDHIENKLLIQQALTKLTYLQKKVIIKKFITYKTDTEIAQELNISRQAVNRIKNRALNNLRKYLTK